MNPLRRPTLLCLALLCALAAPASAAYAPKLDVKVDPATPGQAISIVSTITQANGETPNKTVKVAFPTGFTANQPKVGICTQAQQDARACPDDARIGDAKAVASVLGLPVDLSGPVYYGGPQPDNTIKIIVFLDNAMLNQHQTILGFISLRQSDAGFDTLFDNLPNTLTTSFRLTFNGGDVALTRSPVTCGTAPFVGEFTSQNGEHAASNSEVTISGCTPTPPRIGAIGFTPERVRPGRATTIDFTLSEPAALVVDVKNPKRKRVRRLTVSGQRGTNELRVKLPRHAKPGRYRAIVTATGSDGLTATRSDTFTVRKAARKRKHRR